MAEDNHYIPIFYQKRWAIRPDRRVCLYSRPYKRAHVQRKHPKGVGYQRDLYTVTNTDAAVATYLERQFFKTTDDLGSKALAVIEAGQWQPMDTRIRSGWTRFIMSLLHRNPEQIGTSLQTVSRYVMILKPQYQRLYQDKKDANHPLTFEEFWHSILPEVVGRTWIKLIQTTVDSKLTGQHFNSLIWRVLDFKSSYTFLTGDRPIIMTNGMVKNDSHLAIPIGPRKLFVAAHTTDLADALVRDKADDVVTFVNDKIARQARRFCIGINDSQLSFFVKRFGEMLPSSPFDTVTPPTDEELAELALENEEIEGDFLSAAGGSSPRRR
jgi:Protein of unknown function (DUF4238)